LLADGAMGTQLQLAGLEPGACGEAWNVDAPHKVEAIQRAYVEAGSDCLITNTFGASRIMLERHDEGDRVTAINRRGAEIAQLALGQRGGFVLGDIGPFGGLMVPYGEVEAEQVADAFAEQAEALVAGGVDAIIIETQTALEELALAVAAARDAGAPCIIGSLAFDRLRDGSGVRTMMGVSPEKAAEEMAGMGVDVLGLNCGTGIDMAVAADTVTRYRSSCDLPVMAQPNAGQPELIDMKVVYRQPPKEMATGMEAVLAAGARIVGGCCGSTPEHIRHLRRLLDKHRIVVETTP
jgi:5-methyltetrahydrofolate--homocysteine methyltransferase